MTFIHTLYSMNTKCFCYHCRQHSHISPLQINSSFVSLDCISHLYDKNIMFNLVNIIIDQIIFHHYSYQHTFKELYQRFYSWNAEIRHLQFILYNVDIDEEFIAHLKIFINSIFIYKIIFSYYIIKCLSLIKC